MCDQSKVAKGIGQRANLNGERLLPSYFAFRPLPFALRGGLTLIELIVVMTLLVLLAFIATPSFVKATKTAKVRSAVQRLVVTLRYARAKALSLGRPVLVELDRESNTVRVLIPADVAERQLTGRPSPVANRSIEEWTDEDWWKLSGERLETLDPLEFAVDPSPMGKERTLPDGVPIASVTDLVSGEELNLVAFYPDGTASGVRIVVQGERLAIMLEIAPTTGNTILKEISPSEGQKGRR